MDVINSRGNAVSTHFAAAIATPEKVASIGSSLTSERLVTSQLAEFSSAFGMDMRLEKEGVNFYTTLLPAFNYLAKKVETRKKKQEKPLAVNASLFDRFSKKLRRVRAGAARWPSLHEIYNVETTIFQNPFDLFWLNVLCAQDVRNRTRIVVAALRKEVLHQLKTKKVVHIVSYACGSAQAVLDAVHDLPQGRVRITAIDQDPTALAQCKALAEEIGFTNLETQEGNVIPSSSGLALLQPDIVEMVGLIDYFKDSSIISMFKRIIKGLPEGGCLITAHIHDNSERYMVHKLYDWNEDMLYRTKTELEQLICQGGFRFSSYFTTPIATHTVVVAHK